MAERMPSGKRALLTVSLAALYAAARFIALVPLLFPALTAFLPLTEKALLLVRFGLCALLFMLFVFPERIFSRAVLTRLAADTAPEFSCFGAIRRGLYRVLRVLPLLLPFLLLAGLSVYLFWFSDFTALKLLKQISTFVGVSGEKRYDAGAALVILPTLALLIALLIRWHMDFPYDYIKNKRLARGLSKTPAYRRLSLQNLLLALPPFAACALVVFPTLASHIVVGKGMFELVGSVNSAIQTPLTAEQRMLFALVFVFLYLPLYLYRKFRAAKLCAERGARRAA